MTLDETVETPMGVLDKTVGDAAPRTCKHVNSATVLALLSQSPHLREISGGQEPMTVIRKLRMERYFEDTVNTAAKGGDVSSEQCAKTIADEVAQALCTSRAIA